MTLLMMIDWIFGIYMAIGLAMQLLCECVMRSTIRKLEGNSEYNICLYNCYKNGFTGWFEYSDILVMIARWIAWPVCYPIRMIRFMKAVSNVK